MTPMARAAYLLSVLLAAIAAFVLVQPRQHGDVAEYTLMTIAIANHGTPDITLADIADGKRMLPGLSGLYSLLEDDMRAGREEVFPAFARGRDGAVYANHFFAYSALAVLPFKLLQAAGRDPFSCYLAVNLAALVVLACYLLRFFQSGLRAWCALLLFLACGSMLYLPWTSTETATAALLLAALCAFFTGAPLAAALLAALAALQNPTIVLFFGFAPLLHAVLERQPLLERRTLAALAAGGALALLPMLFNQWQFGVPSVIARTFSSSRLIGLTRLHSLFFDLNQGMLIGIPAVVLALLLWGWRRGWRDAAALLLTVAFSVAVCVPALAIWNFNSGAAGIMRYAVWAAMPLLFLLLWRMRAAARWPWAMLAAAAPLQAAAMWHAAGYGYMEFSPLAQAVMRHAPALYHPEPEVFGERSVHGDEYIDMARVYRWPAEGAPAKQLYNAAYPGIEQRLCGAGREPANTVASYRSWRYIDGALQCQPADTRVQRISGEALMKTARAGWRAATVQETGCAGLWSEGAQSVLEVALPSGATATSISLAGQYASKNNYTRVWIDGRDMGLQQLDQLATLALAPDAVQRGRVTLRLQHEGGAAARANDGRAFCLQQLVLR